MDFMPSSRPRIRTSMIPLTIESEKLPPQSMESKQRQARTHKKSACKEFFASSFHSQFSHLMCAFVVIVFLRGIWQNGIYVDVAKEEEEEERKMLPKHNSNVQMQMRMC
jgi:hypothetical protein